MTKSPSVIMSGTYARRPAKKVAVVARLCNLIVTLHNSAVLFPIAQKGGYGCSLFRDWGCEEKSRKAMRLFWLYKQDIQHQGESRGINFFLVFIRKRIFDMFGKIGWRKLWGKMAFESQRPQGFVTFIRKKIALKE